METPTVYNQEEVQELFDVVFKLSAKDIDNKLKKVTNRPEIAKRRWFWELLQNAKDSVKPNEKVSVKLFISNENGQPFVEFLHNGNPFRYQDAKNLIFPYSDKEDEENSDKSGRFGTGFLATHILSKKIKVKGIYIKDDQALDFNFVLDRTGRNKPEIAESINNTWQEFRKSRTPILNYIYDQTTYETSFRYDLDADNLNTALTSISDFSTSMPFVLSFIPKIQDVEIINSFDGRKILFRKTKLVPIMEGIWHYVIEKVTTSNGTSQTTEINLIICSDGVIDIAVEIFENNGCIYLKNFLEHQPILYCSFPLIGANDFKFPTVVNSTSFIPKEERDGIWLDNAGYGTINQKLFEQTIILYNNLCSYASSQKWQKTFLLFKSLNEEVVLADFNMKWFKEKVQSELQKKVLQIPLIDLQNGQRVSATKVYFISDAKEEYRLLIWDYLKDAFPNKVTMKEEVHEWYEVIWKDCPSVTTTSLTKYISSLKTVETLQTTLGKTKDETLNWLNSYVTFVNKSEPTLLNGVETQILPNQFGAFKRKDELYLDDDTIVQDLKEILATIAGFTKKVYDWRSDMLEKNIFLELPANRVRTIALIGTTITETIKEFLREDSPSNEMRDLFSRLLTWLTENPQKAKDYFKGLKTDTLLYKCADERKMGKFTEMFRLDREGKMNVEEQLSILKDPRIHLLNDPKLELKVRLGEQVLADLQKEKDELEFKKATGDIFESMFQQLINADNRFSIQKVEGEEDFIITNNSTENKFYIELKSIKNGEQQIQMTHKQAKKAHAYPSCYFLCIIPNNGSLIDETYFKNQARFDGTIGTKLSNKINAALNFEAPETGITVEFEDDLLRSYNKYRYKFSIQHILLGQDNFDAFTTKLN